MKYLNNILFFSLLFSITVLTAQEKRQNIDGSVIHDKYGLQFINIQNLATKKGTISDTSGNFNISVKKGDTILFSSLVYKNRKIEISDTHISNKMLRVFLESGINELGEVFIEGYVNPDFSKVTVHKNTVYDYDKIDNSKAPNIAKSINPVKANGIGLINIIQALTKNIRLKRREKKALLNKIENQKKQIPILIKQKFGKELFTKTLRIEEDKIEIFIEYCQENDLGNLYNHPDIEIINFLVIQSKKFNKITN